MEADQDLIVIDIDRSAQKRIPGKIIIVTLVERTDGNNVVTVLDDILNLHALWEVDCKQKQYRVLGHSGRLIEAAGTSGRTQFIEQPDLTWNRDLGSSQTSIVNFVCSRFGSISVDPVLVTLEDLSLVAGGDRDQIVMNYLKSRAFFRDQRDQLSLNEILLSRPF